MGKIEGAAATDAAAAPLSCFSGPRPRMVARFRDSHSRRALSHLWERGGEGSGRVLPWASFGVGAAVCAWRLWMGIVSTGTADLSFGIVK